MKKYKSIICLLIITAFLFSLLGCSQGKPRETATPSNSDIPSETVRDYVADPPSEKCSIEKIGDNYYLFIEDIEYYENRGSDGSLGATFYSFEEFRDALVNCKLSRAGLEDAALDFERDEIGIKICDPYNMYIPSLPENLRAEDEITWYGDAYVYFFSEKKYGDTEIAGSILYCSKERLNSIYEANSEQYSNNTFYMLNNEDKQIKIIEGWGTITMYVFEKKLSYQISLFSVDMSPVEEWRPSDEWLLSFGMTKYIELEATE